MAASAGSTQASAELLQQLGLVDAHSYGLIKVCEITDIFEDTHRIVQLRNPWGAECEFEWKGDWSDDSDLWTDDLKKQAGFDNLAEGNEGIFWMSLNDLCKYFSRI